MFEYVWALAVTGMLVVLALIGKFSVKNDKFRRYTKLLVTAIEVAKDSEEVKRMVEAAVRDDVSINTADFSKFIQDVVKSVK